VQSARVVSARAERDDEGVRPSLHASGCRTSRQCRSESPPSWDKPSEPPPHNIAWRCLEQSLYLKQELAATKSSSSDLKRRLAAEEARAQELEGTVRRTTAERSRLAGEAAALHERLELSIQAPAQFAAARASEKLAIRSVERLSELVSLVHPSRLKRDARNACVAILQGSQPLSKVQPSAALTAPSHAGKRGGSAPMTPAKGEPSSSSPSKDKTTVSAPTGCSAGSKSSLLALATPASNGRYLDEAISWAAATVASSRECYFERHAQATEAGSSSIVVALQRVVDRRLAQVLTTWKCCRIATLMLQRCKSTEERLALAGQDKAGHLACSRSREQVIRCLVAWKVHRRSLVGGRMLQSKAASAMAQVGASVLGMAAKTHSSELLEVLRAWRLAVLQLQARCSWRRGTDGSGILASACSAWHWLLLSKIMSVWRVEAKQGAWRHAKLQHLQAAMMAFPDQLARQALQAWRTYLHDRRSHNVDLQRRHCVSECLSRMTDMVGKRRCFTAWRFAHHSLHARRQFCTQAMGMPLHHDTYLLERIWVRWVHCLRHSQRVTAVDRLLVSAGQTPAQRELLSWVLHVWREFRAAPLRARMVADTLGKLCKKREAAAWCRWRVSHVKLTEANQRLLDMEEFASRASAAHQGAFSLAVKAFARQSDDFSTRRLFDAWAKVRVSSIIRRHSVSSKDTFEQTQQRWLWRCFASWSHSTRHAAQTRTRAQLHCRIAAVSLLGSNHPSWRQMLFKAWADKAASKPKMLQSARPKAKLLNIFREWARYSLKARHMRRVGVRFGFLLQTGDKASLAAIVNSWRKVAAKATKSHAAIRWTEATVRVGHSSLLVKVLSAWRELLMQATSKAFAMDLVRQVALQKVAARDNKLLRPVVTAWRELPKLSMLHGAVSGARQKAAALLAFGKMQPTLRYVWDAWKALPEAAMMRAIAWKSQRKSQDFSAMQLSQAQSSSRSSVLKACMSLPGGSQPHLPLLVMSAWKQALQLSHCHLHAATVCKRAKDRQLLSAVMASWASAGQGARQAELKASVLSGQRPRIRKATVLTAWRHLAAASASRGAAARVFTFSRHGILLALKFGEWRRATLISRCQEEVARSSSQRSQSPGWLALLFKLWAQSVSHLADVKQATKAASAAAAAERRRIGASAADEASLRVCRRIPSSGKAFMAWRRFAREAKLACGAAAQLSTKTSQLVVSEAFRAWAHLGALAAQSAAASACCKVLVTRASARGVAASERLALALESSLLLTPVWSAWRNLHRRGALARKQALSRCAGDVRLKMGIVVAAWRRAAENSRGQARLMKERGLLLGGALAALGSSHRAQLERLAWTEWRRLTEKRVARRGLVAKVHGRGMAGAPDACRSCLRRQYLHSWRGAVNSRSSSDQSYSQSQATIDTISLFGPGDEHTLPSSIHRSPAEASPALAASPLPQGSGTRHVPRAPGSHGSNRHRKLHSSHETDSDWPSASKRRLPGSEGRGKHGYSQASTRCASDPSQTREGSNRRSAVKSRHAGPPPFHDAYDGPAGYMALDAEGNGRQRVSSRRRHASMEMSGDDEVFPQSLAMRSLPSAESPEFVLESRQASKDTSQTKDAARSRSLPPGHQLSPSTDPSGHMRASAGQNTTRADGTLEEIWSATPSFSSRATSQPIDSRSRNNASSVQFVAEPMDSTFISSWDSQAIGTSSRRVSPMTSPCKGSPEQAALHSSDRRSSSPRSSPLKLHLSDSRTEVREGGGEIRGAREAELRAAREAELLAAVEATKRAAREAELRAAAEATKRQRSLASLAFANYMEGSSSMLLSSSFQLWRSHTCSRRKVLKILSSAGGSDSRFALQQVRRDAFAAWRWQACKERLGVATQVRSSLAGKGILAALLQPYRRSLAYALQRLAAPTHAASAVLKASRVTNAIIAQRGRASEALLHSVVVSCFFRWVAAAVKRCTQIRERELIDSLAAHKWSRHALSSMRMAWSGWIMQRNQNERLRRCRDKLVAAEDKATRLHLNLVLQSWRQATEHSLLQTWSKGALASAGARSHGQLLRTAWSAWLQRLTSARKMAFFRKTAVAARTGDQEEGLQTIVWARWATAVVHRRRRLDGVRALKVALQRPLRRSLEEAMRSWRGGGPRATQRKHAVLVAERTFATTGPTTKRWLQQTSWRSWAGLARGRRLRQLALGAFALQQEELRNALLKSVWHGWWAEVVSVVRGRTAAKQAASGESERLFRQDLEGCRKEIRALRHQNRTIRDRVKELADKPQRERSASPNRSSGLKALMQVPSAPALPSPPLEPELTDDSVRALRPLAQDVMFLADKHAKNGQLTCTEMQTFLRGTKYEGFMRWITDMKQWCIFDKDLSGTIALNELQAALRAYQAQTGDLVDAEPDENDLANIHDSLRRSLSELESVSCGGRSASREAALLARPSSPKPGPRAISPWARPRCASMSLR